jgi:D-alanyl-D-alanine carboxypeptidase
MLTSRHVALPSWLVPFIIAALFVAPASAFASSAADVPPLPECRYDDALTPRRAYADWDKTLLDPIYMVPKSYTPPGLAPVGDAGVSGKGKVRKLVLAELASMTAAARAAGKPIAVQSAYRSYAKQESIFNANVAQYGFKNAALSSARPGHSEHQLGTTLDFKSKGGPAPWELKDWATTPAGKWMKNNAWKYGFVMSYPQGKSPSVTCYKYEPWHYRYFGRKLSRAITQSGLSTREWLWARGYGL